MLFDDHAAKRAGAGGAIIEAPQGFVIAEECRKAAWQNGYRRALGEMAGWACYGSTTAKGTIALAAAGAKGPWFLAIDHVGVVEELKHPRAGMPGPGDARYAFATLGALYEVLPKVYALAVALPDGPLEAFQDAVKDLPKTTVAERLVLQRIGQDIFRERLMAYWHRRCPLTGITDPSLLRASHMIPWAKCLDDAERLNVHNGLLLSGLWDAAFDRGLVTFDDDGHPVFSPGLSEAAKTELRWYQPIPLTDKHRMRLAWHRAHLFEASMG
ncbi:HNH endonuclease [Azospirillum oryzae]|uniref:HNH endonuclease n=1 Tax=Azospirillum oryzae TaxID=286727 RepID=A0A1X7FNK6_9PROT|nr:HNH endonuclease [Azospirillum oryzae]SMF55606.1 HNH endonuclease [Azospirillum oryzae]